MTGRIFIKQTSSSQAASAEVSGLKALETLLQSLPQRSIAIPSVISQQGSRLELVHIDACRPSEMLWQSAGADLATLHNQPQPRFGWEQDNFIGLNPQLNRWSDNWGDFFVNFRLGPQLGWFAGSPNAQLYHSILERQRVRLIEYLNETVQHPSLVHGDLWSGNLLFDTNQPWLIDPAVYCADAEVDIAMTRMFGSFSASFYQTYRELRPAPTDIERRHQFYNLYHALNHANLFGGGYFQLCQQGFELLERL